MKTIKRLAAAAATIACLFSSSTALAETQFDKLSISTIRAVGQYSDPAFANTLEVWFTVPLAVPAGSPCTDTRRVYIDAKHYHLVAMAQMAFMKGRQVNVALDTRLPIRGGACEVVYIDMLPGA